MSEPQKGGQPSQAWNATQAFVCILMANLAICLAILALWPRNSVDLVLRLFPLLGLVWNAALCAWLRSKGGTDTLMGALVASAAVLLVSSGCSYFLATFRGG